MNFQDDHEHIEDILEATKSVALRFLESLSTRPAGCALQGLLHDVLSNEGVGAITALTMFHDKYTGQAPSLRG
jgi:hypothetical protein